MFGAYFPGYHAFCCTPMGGGGDATLANQNQLLADVAVLKQCVVDMQVDVDDIEAGVNSIESAVVQPEIC